MKISKLLEKNKAAHPKEVEEIRGKLIADEIHEVGVFGKKYSVDDEIAILKKTVYKLYSIISGMGYSVDIDEFQQYVFDTEQAKANADKK